MSQNFNVETAIANSPEFDMTMRDARLLFKAIRQREHGKRRRTISNVYSTGHGRAQPREGFLSFEIMRAIYLKSEVIRACVDTLIEIVAGVDWDIRLIDEEKAKWMRSRRPEDYQSQQKRIAWAETFFRRPNAVETFDTFQRRILRDLLIYDAASFEIVSADFGSYQLPVELGVISADTMEIETDDAGMVTRYWQSYNVVKNTPFELEDVEYFCLNPNSWSAYGISPIETAYVSIASDLMANKYNANYFDKDGIPPGLLAVLGVSNQEFQRIMTQMRSTSADNPHNIHAFRAQRNPDGNAQKVFDFQPLSQVSNRDMQFVELLTHTIRRITMIYRISPSQIGFTDEITGGIGSGVAETQVDLMESKGVAPILKKLSEVFTSVLHKVCGWTDLEFAFTQSQTPKEIQEYQRDQGEVSNGAMTVNELRSKWGGREPVPWGELPLSLQGSWQPPMSPQQQQQMLMQQASQQSVQQQQPEQLQKSAHRRIIINL
jgi:phage portal protein BeeE